MTGANHFFFVFGNEGGDGFFVATATGGIDDFECSAFDGKYVTGDIDEGYLTALSLARNDQSKQRQDAQFQLDGNVLELHNHA